MKKLSSLCCSSEWFYLHCLHLSLRVVTRMSVIPGRELQIKSGAAISRVLLKLHNLRTNIMVTTS